jgi:hypothetical protein
MHRITAGGLVCWLATGLYAQQPIRAHPGDGLEVSGFEGIVPGLPSLLELRGTRPAADNPIQPLAKARLRLRPACNLSEGNSLEASGRVCQQAELVGEESRARPAGDVLSLDSKPRGIWENGVVESGFRKGTDDAGFTLGGGIGLALFGTEQVHDLALTSIHYGRVLSGVVGKDKWWRGNWELRAELFGGGQFSPRTAYVVGGAPVLRYSFATGTRWVPFLDAGAGITATDIKQPDLSSVFQFNLGVGPGVHYFWRKGLAATLQARLLHISDAGFLDPNDGVNAITITGGLSWFF